MISYHKPLPSYVSGIPAMLPLNPTHSTIYSPRSRKWITAFQPTQGHKLHSASDLQSVIHGTCDRAPPTSGHQYSRPRKWWSHCIAQDAPEMGPAAPFLADMLEESELVSSRVPLSDPSVGHLVAFGKAADIENKSTRLVDATAFATGPVGADLGVAAVAGRVVDVQGGKGKVVIPRVLRGGDPPIAHRFQNPIKQVKFAGGVGESARPYLAVRTSAGTTIFKQTRLQVSLPGMPNRYWSNRMLSIDENTDGGGPVHADVDFNPWYHRQFGIVDEVGKWRVWDIEGCQTTIGMPWRVREVAMGSIAMGDQPSAPGNWGRICWGADLNTILVAGRRRAGAFDLRAPPTDISSIAIPVDPRTQILDFKRGPSPFTNPTVFTLTSTSLLWFDMRQPKTPLMNCQHYRHQSDALLSLELFNLSDSITNALIYSRMNFLINSFRFTRTAEEQFPVLLGNPGMLTPPPFPYKGVSTPVIYSMSIVSCKESNVSRVDPSLSFFSGFAIDKDLAISQRIYVSSADGDAGEVKLEMGRRERLTMVAPKSNTMVIGSDEESEAEALPALPEGMVAGMISRKRTNFGDLYEYAFTQGEEATMTVKSEEGHLEEARKLLEKRIDKGDLGVISLLDVLQPQWLFGDLSAFEESIRNLLSQERMTEYQTSSLISSLSPRDLLSRKPSEDAEATLSIQGLYRTLMDLWVHPLPAESVFGRVRLRRERLCRMIATEIWLSSIGLNLLPKALSAAPPPPLTTATTASSSQQPSSPPPATSTTTTPSESLLRIRTYANVSTPHLLLTPSMSSVLDTWTVGSDPSSPSPGHLAPTPKRASNHPHNHHHRRRRRSPGRIEGLREDVEKWSMGQRAPPGVLVVIDKGKGKGKGGGGAAWGSQPTGGAAPSSQEGTGEVTMSQPERGVFGGRRGRPARKKRRTGF